MARTVVARRRHEGLDHVGPRRGRLRPTPRSDRVTVESATRSRSR
jgi:hypothetical protein